MIGLTISHYYRMLEKLGGGGMGEVYKSEDARLHRFDALKFLPEDIAQGRPLIMRAFLKSTIAGKGPVCR